MSRFLVLAFSGFSYGLFLLVFLYLLAFLTNLQMTPLAESMPWIQSLIVYSIDMGRPVPGLAVALVINLALIGLFGIQHSVMARREFKRLVDRVLPKGSERANYVLLSSLVLALVMWQWRPIPEPVIWYADSTIGETIGWSVLGLGVATLLWSTFLIDHFDLFGLKQAWLRFMARPYEHSRFVTPALYQFVRHPLYVGWFLIFWGTPVMSLGHLLFALGMSAYIFIAIRYEERDLVRSHGESYLRYQQEVPMVLPRPGRRYRAPRSL